MCCFCWQCLQAIETSLEAAKQLIADVDLELLVHDQYGKGFMKVCRVSPDAYIQLALQIAYYRVRVHWSGKYMSYFTLYGEMIKSDTCSHRMKDFVFEYKWKDRVSDCMVSRIWSIVHLNRKITVGFDSEWVCFDVRFDSFYLRLSCKFVSYCSIVIWKIKTWRSLLLYLKNMLYKINAENFIDVLKIDT